MSNYKGPGQVEISFEFSRHVGPRIKQGGLTLQFDSLQPYKFVSTAEWPSIANYENTIREAVESVLIEKLGDLTTTRVVLKSIRWHDIDSSEFGFQQAAKIATQLAFQV